MDSLNRIPLTVRLADQIEADIRNGGWTQAVPGYRSLAERYGTSRKTCLGALDILEHRGFLRPAIQGKCRKIVQEYCRHNARTHEHAPKDQKRNLLILHSNQTPMDDEGERVLWLCSEEWRRASGDVHAVPVDFGRYKDPSTRIRSMIARYRAGALVLYLASSAWVRAADALLPTYLMGGEAQDVTCAGHGFLLKMETLRLLRWLKGLGHQRILIPVEGYLSHFREILVSSLQESSGELLKPGLIEELCPVFTEGIPHVWHAIGAVHFHGQTQRRSLCSARRMSFRCTVTARPGALRFHAI
jgi:hypothetical protein